MRYFILSIIVLSGLGCGVGFDASNKSAEILPYIQLFESTYGIKYNGNYFFVDNLPQGTIARGGLSKQGGKQIYIQESEWRKLTHWSKIILVFHELTHANFLHFKHHDGTIILNNKDCPASIMNTWLFNEYCFEDNYDYYIKELRKHFHSVR